MAEDNPSDPPESDVSAKDFEAQLIPSKFPSSRKSSLEPLVPSREGTPPPLPPRPKTAVLLNVDRPATSRSFRAFSAGVNRPGLQTAQATTGVSFTDVHTLSAGDDKSHDSPASRRMSFSTARGRNASRSGSEPDDSASIRSYAPTLEPGTDIESLLGDGLAEQGQSTMSMLSPHLELGYRPDEPLFAHDLMLEKSFKHEFDEVDEIEADGSNEEHVVAQWKSKLKHFLILSSAGKPIWSRHGDDQLITNYIGVVQTIISFYQGANDELKSFTAGDVRFVVMSKGSLNLVAITRLGESDAQLRAQLEALYMQILSTLTLPSMEKMFSNRPSYDLRRPLQGTEVLLSALADGFTRGSPSTLLSALECLRVRKTHRQVINNTLLKTRSPNLLYGLIVAGGRLVSVVRPKRHSLHPGDLHLIFNMLFEAGSVKAGGGENWIPLCLPGFNNTGYLYMYVSFLSATDSGQEVTERPSSSGDSDDEVAILLISANKEGFFELRSMRDDLIEQLEKNGSLNIIRSAVKKGRLSCTDILPGTVLRHFLYKSRGNVQFIMPSFEPHFATPISRRQLITLYARLHAQLHTRPTNLKIHHSTSTHSISLAWSTPLFELYAIAPSATPRVALAQAANKLIQWVRREEDRVFIIGGATF